MERDPPEGRPTSIQLELILGGDLTAEQTARLRQVAERCPVHRALSEGVRIVQVEPGATN